MTTPRATVVGQAILVAVFMTVGSAVLAAAMDADLLRTRIQPRAELHGEALAVSNPLLDQEALSDAQGRDRAFNISRKLASQQLNEWVSLVDYAPLKRFQQHGFNLTTQSLSGDYSPTAEESQGDSSAYDGLLPFQLSLRVKNDLRVRVSGADFSRDLMYDPVRGKLWWDLYRLRLSDDLVGLSVTNSYHIDEDNTRLIFRLDHRLP